MFLVFFEKCLGKTQRERERNKSGCEVMDHIIFFSSFRFFFFLPVPCDTPQGIDANSLLAFYHKALLFFVRKQTTHIHTQKQLELKKTTTTDDPQNEIIIITTKSSRQAHNTHR